MHETHPENPIWNITFIDSNISCSFEPNVERDKTNVPSSVEIITITFAGEIFELNCSGVQTFAKQPQEIDCINTDIATNQTNPFNSVTSPKVRLGRNSENLSHIQIYLFDHFSRITFIIQSKHPEFVGTVSIWLLAAIVLLVE